MYNSISTNCIGTFVLTSSIEAGMLIDVCKYIHTHKYGMLIHLHLHNHADLFQVNIQYDMYV